MGRLRVGILKRASRNQAGFIKMRIIMDEAQEMMNMSISSNVLLVVKYRNFVDKETRKEGTVIDRFKTVDLEDDLILEIQAVNRSMSVIKNKLKSILEEGRFWDERIVP
jgi:hypothetical protein